MGDYEDRARHFDKKIPNDVRGVDEISAKLRADFGHVLPDDLIDGMAPDIEKFRERRADDTVSTDSQGYYDPDAGRWRDPDTGGFISGGYDDG